MVIAGDQNVLENVSENVSNFETFAKPDTIRSMIG